jgi:hypothetical protein
MMNDEPKTVAASVTSTPANARTTRNCNLEDVCGVLGYRATRILAGWYAGRYLRVPRSMPAPGHPLATLVGEQSLRRLVAEFGGSVMSIRSQADDLLIHRDRTVADAFARGDSVAEVARLCGVTHRRADQLKHALTANGMIDYARLDALGENPNLDTPRTGDGAVDHDER